MIETLENPLPVAQSGQRDVVGGTKRLTSQELNEHRRNGMPVAAMNLCIVSVDTIFEPIAAIPDQGGTPGDFLFIRPADNWGYGFTQLIEDNEAAELAELNAMDGGVSDTSDEEEEQSDDSTDNESSDSSSTT